MGLFMMPFSGHAVGGGGHSPTDPAPSGIDGPKGQFSKRRRLKGLDRVPPGQIPSPPPPYAWPPLERRDWRPGLSVIESRFRLSEDDVPAAASPPTTKSLDPVQTKRALLHAEATKLRQEIAELRSQVARTLEASRQQHAYSSGVGAQSPFAHPSALPKLPRATRPFPMPKQEAWGPPKMMVVPPGTPLHMRTGPMTLGPVTSHLVGLRAEISKKRLRLAQIRSELKTITGKNHVFNTSLKRPPMAGAPVQHKVQGVTKVRHSWLGAPKTSTAKPVGPAAQKLKSHGPQWTKKPAEHRTEEHHPRFVSRGRRWRSLLKSSQ